jgi:hypothetical protein
MLSVTFVGSVVTPTTLASRGGRRAIAEAISAFASLANSIFPSAYAASSATYSNDV